MPRRLGVHALGRPDAEAAPPIPAEKPLPTVRAVVKGQRITLTIPEEAYESVKVEKYEAKTSGPTPTSPAILPRRTKRIAVSLLFYSPRFNSPNRRRETAPFEKQGCRRSSGVPVGREEIGGLSTGAASIEGAGE